MTAIKNLHDLPTPCLLLDEDRMARNNARMKARLNRMGVLLNPHLKTAKCVEIAHRLVEHPSGPCTVSTLEEAEQLAAAGGRSQLHH